MRGKHQLPAKINKTNQKLRRLGRKAEILQQQYLWGAFFARQPTSHLQTTQSPQPLSARLHNSSAFHFRFLRPAQSTSVGAAVCGWHRGLPMPRVVVPEPRKPTETGVKYAEKLIHAAKLNVFIRGITAWVCRFTVWQMRDSVVQRR